MKANKTSLFVCHSPFKPSAHFFPLMLHLPISALLMRCATDNSNWPVQVNKSKDKNLANAFGNISYSRSDGVCILKLLAGEWISIVWSCTDPAETWQHLHVWEADSVCGYHRQRGQGASSLFRIRSLKQAHTLTGLCHSSLAAVPGKNTPALMMFINLNIPIKIMSFKEPWGKALMFVCPCLVGFGKHYRPEESA